MQTKKALCIHDISGIGRCSLTVIAPVLSVKGIQCVPLPTTVLSTHFGGFGAVASNNLTNYCLQALTHYKNLALTFDCVYSGYLADTQQMLLVQTAFTENPSALKICDPVMGDNGKVYTSITEDMIKGFQELCSYSDVITPNITEANLLLGRSVSESEYSIDEILELALKLKQRYHCGVVITGIKLENQLMICCGVAKQEENPFVVECSYVPVHFPGTGDLFCATMTAYLMQGDSLEDATYRATRFVEKCVKYTFSMSNVDTRFGVDLEPNLKYLIQ